MNTKRHTYAYPNLDSLFVQRYACPLGSYLLVSSERGLVYLGPEDGEPHLGHWEHPGIPAPAGGKHIVAISRELDEYFAGRLRHFSVPLDLWGTSFQRRVWQELLAIPYGETRSYSQVAHALGQPTASRAVGHANGCNPVAIVVPCHRVIGARGDLVGYAGGLPRKHLLLDLEARVLAEAWQD